MRHLTLAQAREGFKLTNQAANKAKKTIRWYDAHLERFETFLLSRSVSNTAIAVPVLKDITTEDIRQFITHLQGKTACYEGHPTRPVEPRPLSAYTIRGIVATLSAFFGWAVKEGILNKDPMERIARPKVPKLIKERFSEEDIKKLLDACKRYPQPLELRNRAIILFLLDTGVRANELSTLTLEHVDLEHGRAHVHGKGAKDREVFFGRNTHKALWQYVTQGRPEHSNCPRFFLTQRGNPITPLELDRILRHLGEEAGVAHVHPHRFRHTAARFFIRNGGDAFSLQRLLGHEGLETTRRYVELEREDVERAHARASPVDHLDLT